MLISLISVFLFSATPTALTKEDRDKLTQVILVDDDDLSNDITVSTRLILKDKGYSSTDLEDKYFIMSINKKTNEKSYFMVFSKSYLAKRMRFYNSIAFIGAEGVKNVRIVAAKRNVEKCYSALKECLYKEVFTVSIVKQDFLHLVSIQPELKPWYVKLSSRNSPSQRTLFFPVEAALLNEWKPDE